MNKLGSYDNWLFNFQFVGNWATQYELPNFKSSEEDIYEKPTFLYCLAYSDVDL